MNDPLFKKYLEALERTIGRHKLAIRPFTCEEDPAVRHFVYLLGIPAKQLYDCLTAATRIAIDIYGPMGIPFFVGVATAKTAREHFPEEFGRSA